MQPRKRILSDDEANPPKPAKSSRKHDGDTPNLGPNLPTQRVEDIERRPKRTNQGQGGVGHQLAELEKKLRPDLQPQAAKKSKAVVNIPDSAPTNRMAPQAPEKAVKAKRAIPTKVLFVVRKEDPPLGHGAPKPSQHKVTAEGTRFGFQPSAVPAAQRVPVASLERESPTNIRVTATHVHKTAAVTYTSDAKKARDRLPRPSGDVGRVSNCSPPPPARSKPTRALQEIVPDSEPERTLNTGNDGNDSSMTELSGTEESDPNDENPDASGEEDGHELDLSLDPAALAEMEMDGLANEFEDGLVHPDSDHDQDQAAMEIDEDSPDEDDRRALAALQDQEQMDEGDEVPYSVLEAHHNTNRKVRAPDSEDLTRARDHQSRASVEAPSLSKQRHDHKMRPTREDADDDADNEAEEADEEAVLQAKRAIRNSQESEPLPTQMQFYRGNAPWTDILEHAKHDYRLYIHTRNPFPERTAETLRIAGDFVLERMAQYEEDQRNKEPLDDSYYDLRAMSSLIFEDGASYRGQLKTQCRLFTTSHFASLLQPDCPNQLDFTATVQANAKELRKKGFFLQGGRDENGKIRNFGNSLIATVCQAFYYSKKKSCLNVLFPRDFDELPWESLAMVCACIANCIDEYVSGTQTTLKFDGDSYAGVHEAVMILLARADEDEYHGPRLRQMLRDIVRNGRMRSNTPKSTPQNADLELDLD